MAGAYLSIHAARLHQTTLVDEHDRLHPVSKPELGEASGNVGLDRPLTHVERLGYLGVGGTLGDQLEHLDLTIGERGQLGSEPGAAGPDDRLGPVGHLELGEDVGDVVAHRLGAHQQASSDEVVRQASGDEVEYLSLSGSQSGEGLVVTGSLAGGEKPEKPVGHARTEDGIPSPDASTARMIST